VSTSERRSDCEVAVIGAGPYGLSAAAHLKSAGVHTLVFGSAMSFWRQNMPKGMNLRSPLVASNLSDAAGEFTLPAYARAKGMTLQYPVPLDEFVRYGEWFQRNTTRDLVSSHVTHVEAAPRGFRLTLCEGEPVHARRVVVALGLANQEYRPDAFKGLPPQIVSHACEHDDLGVFRGRHVAVIGRGQSACESAVLLKENGAEVDVVCRGPIHWLGAAIAATAEKREALWTLHERLLAPSGVGPFPLSWMVEAPGLVRQLPFAARQWVNARSLRAGVAGWVRTRFGGIGVDAGRHILSAREQNGRVAVETDAGMRLYDHVLLATGYGMDLAKYGILSPGLLAGIDNHNGAPLLPGGFESSVEGLHFIGASAVRSYGPLMRFIAGAPYAARMLARSIAAQRLTPHRRRAETGAHASPGALTSVAPSQGSPL
jgi:hypothetical protein